MQTTATDTVFTVAFHGSKGSCWRLPRHRVRHGTLADAVAEIRRVDRLRSGSAKAACPGLVIEPDGTKRVVTNNPTI